MSSSPSDPVPPSPRGWIDVAFLAGGLACTIQGLPVIGVPLLLFGLVAPTLRWSARRHEGGQAILRLVPSELVEANAALRAAAARPGTPDGADALSMAHQAVLEVAAVLVGRPPRGRVQRRLVADRVRLLEDQAAHLREQHQHWLEARAEVEALSAVCLPEPESAAPRDGVLVTMLLVLLAPLFVTWDLLRGFGRGVRGLVDGVVLRAQASVRLVVRLAAEVGRMVAKAARQWCAWRRRVAVAAGEARHRFVAARVRARLRWRVLRRAR